MVDPVDAFFGAESEAPVSEPVEQVVEAVESEPQVEQVEAEPAPEAPPEPKQDHFVPLPKYLDTRDELKEARRKLAEYEAARPQRTIPDALDDPEGFAAFQSEQLGQLKLEMSYEMASDKHGQEKVEAARTWAIERANEDPAFDAQCKIELARQRNPIDWIVRQHQRESMLSQLPTDVSSIEEYIEREIAKRTTGVSAVAQPVAAIVQPASKPAAPPRSIASDVSTSKQVAPSDDKAEFLAAFTRQ